MDEPEATNNAPSPEDVESAVEFFSQGKKIKSRY